MNETQRMHLMLRAVNEAKEALGQCLGDNARLRGELAEVQAWAENARKLFAALRTLTSCPEDASLLKHVEARMAQLEGKGVQ